MPLIRQLSPSDAETILALDAMEMTAPILRDALFTSRPGAADNVKKAGEGNTSDIFRALNEDNAPVAATRNYELIAKKIVSFDAKVDVMLEDRNEDTATELATQTSLEAEDAGYILQTKFFEGDDAVSPDEFDGFRNKVDAGNVRTPAAPIQLPLGNSDANRQAQQAAIEEFLKTAATVKGGASHAYMNEYMKIRLLSIGKELGYYRNQKDDLGSTIEFIGDIAIRGAGYTEAGTPNLPFSETLGADTTTSSIFFARWGERRDLYVMTSRGMVVRFAGQVGNFFVNNANMDAVLVLKNKNALYQHKGWKL